MKSRATEQKQNTLDDRELLALAHQCLEEGDATGALAITSEILEQDFSHLPALEIQARSWWRMDRYTEALLVLDRLTAINPYEPGYYLLRGACQQGLGRFGDAILSFERCASMSDNADAKNASQAMLALQGWQDCLIASMLREDAMFRVEYNRSPREACESRGFAFVERPTLAPTVLMEQSAIAWAHKRPS